MCFVDDLRVATRLEYGFLFEVGCAVVVGYDLGDPVTTETLNAIVPLYGTGHV